jgi:hypothetical protein
VISTRYIRYHSGADLDRYRLIQMCSQDFWAEVVNKHVNGPVAVRLINNLLDGASYLRSPAGKFRERLRLQIWTIRHGLPSVLSVLSLGHGDLPWRSFLARKRIA